MRAAIIEQLVPLDVVPGKLSAHGTKFETRGLLRGPKGVSANVVAVWIVRPGSQAHRPVTLLPGGEP
jgi:hypothetical protein